MMRVNDDLDLEEFENDDTALLVSPVVCIQSVMLTCVEAKEAHRTAALSVCIVIVCIWLRVVLTEEPRRQR